MHHSFMLRALGRGVLSPAACWVLRWRGVRVLQSWLGVGWRSVLLLLAMQRVARDAGTLAVNK